MGRATPTQPARLDGLFAVVAAHEFRRINIVRTVRGREVTQQRDAADPPSEEHHHAVRQFAEALADADPNELPQHRLVPAAVVLDCFRQWPLDQEHFPGRLLGALNAFGTATPRPPLRRETVAEIVGMGPEFEEQAARMLRWTIPQVRAARAALEAKKDREPFDKTALELAPGHQTQAQGIRAEIEAKERSQFLAAQTNFREWRDEQAQSAKPTPQPCPESWEDLFILPGLSDAQAAMMKNTTVETAAAYREEFERSGKCSADT